MAQQALPVVEVATRLSVSPATVRRWIADGRLPVVQVGGRGHAVKIKPADLEQLTEPRPRSAA